MRYSNMLDSEMRRDLFRFQDRKPEFRDEVMRYISLTAEFLHSALMIPEELAAEMRSNDGGFRNQYDDTRLAMLSTMRYFDLGTLQRFYIMRLGHYSTISNMIWDKLVSENLAIETTPAVDVVIKCYTGQWVELNSLISSGTFKNIFFHPAHLYEACKPAIVSIDVQTPDGDVSRGSGFIIGPKPSETGEAIPKKLQILTCKHNVDSNIIVDINSADGRKLSPENIHKSNDHDIACITFSGTFDTPTLQLTGNVEVFDEVFTLGFPYVPRANPILLGHKGEVNAIAARYFERDEVLIISNSVSPGSSGCPVLDRAGRVAGMTIQWLEGEFGAERARFSAAIPARVLKEEVAALQTGAVM